VPLPEGLALSPASRSTWRALLAEGKPHLLPAAHDALTARMIARAGFKAYQVGGFALAGSRYAFPNIDLIHYYEENEAIRQIVPGDEVDRACSRHTQSGQTDGQRGRGESGRVRGGRCNVGLAGS